MSFRVSEVPKHVNPTLTLNPVQYLTSFSAYLSGWEGTKEAKVNVEIYANKKAGNIKARL